jgi:hypothetical protein
MARLKADRFQEYRNPRFHWRCDEGDLRRVLEDEVTKADRAGRRAAQAGRDLSRPARAGMIRTLVALLQRLVDL